jgi:hypothetical protein
VFLYANLPAPWTFEKTWHIKKVQFVPLAKPVQGTAWLKRTSDNSGKVRKPSLEDTLASLELDNL